MADSELIGGVAVQITGDLSGLNAALGGAVNAGRHGRGNRFAVAFNEGAAGADKIEDAFGKISGASHKAVTDIQAVSGTLRTLDGNQGIRAAERFLTMIPGLAPALQAAFPLVGAIAFAEVVGRAVEHFQKLGLGAQEAEEKINSAFREINVEARASNDTLQVGNDRLENEIAKIEHKPENGIKLALDEAIQAADELGKALDSDLSKLGKTVSENKVGMLGQILGQASTLGNRSGTQALPGQCRQSHLAERNSAPGVGRRRFDSFAGAS